MKAVIENGKTYKVTGERGAFTICEDAKGKCKMFETSLISIVEINEMPKQKYSGVKTKKINPANFMSKEEYSKSKYSSMSDYEFEEERKRDAWKSISL